MQKPANANGLFVPFFRWDVPYFSVAKRTDALAHSHKSTTGAAEKPERCRLQLGRNLIRARVSQGRAVAFLEASSRAGSSRRVHGVTEYLLFDLKNLTALRPKLSAYI